MNNDRFKFRYWHKDGIYLSKNELGQYEWGSKLFKVENMNFYDSIVIEQCTNLKDKNGELGYENDIVIDKEGNKFIITWLEPYAGFGLFTLTGLYHYEDVANWLEKYEIISNIHEKKE